MYVLIEIERTLLEYKSRWNNANLYASSFCTAIRAPRNSRRLSLSICFFMFGKHEQQLLGQYTAPIIKVNKSSLNLHFVTTNVAYIISH